MAQVYTIHHLNATEYRLTALEAARNKLFIGDTKGNIFMYNIVNPGTNQETLVQTQATARHGKSKFDKIKADKERGVLFVLSEGFLAAYDLNDLEEVQNFGKNNNTFSINEAPNYGGEVAVVQNKKKIIIYKWNSIKSGARSRPGGFFPEREYPVVEPPAAMIWWKDYICLGFLKKNYMIINSESGQITTMEINTGPTNSVPYIKAMGDDFYCLWGNIFLPMEAATGSNALKNPISFSENKSLVCAAVNDQFMIIATVNTLEVYGISDGSLIQREELNNQPALFIAEHDSQVYYSTTNSLFALHQVPLTDQINRLLLECKIPEARKLLSKMLEGEINTEAQYEQFNLDAAWCLFKQLRFSLSAENFVLTNFDPREIMCMFIDYSVKYSGEKIKNISQVINEGTIGMASGDLTNTVKDKMFQAKLAVISILSQKRKTIFEPPRAGKIVNNYNFLKSTFSLNRLSSEPIPREEIIEQIDTFLLKVLVDLSLVETDSKKFNEKQGKTPTKLLSEMFEPTYKISLNFQECENFLKSKGDKAKVPLAMFYEASGRKEEALKIFRDQTSSDVKTREDFARQTVRILLKVSDRQIVFTYSEWVLLAFPNIGLEIFTSIEAQHNIPHDVVLDHLNKYKSDQISLVEQYLKWIVEVKKVETERYHTRLALCYIEKLFAMLPKGSKDETLPANVNNSTFNRYKADLKKILESSAHYNSKLILDEIVNTWMVEAEVLLLGKEGKHSQALSILINKDNFLEAEKYCTTQGSNLLAALLKVYIDKALDYERKIDPSDQNKSENIANAQKFKRSAFELLKKYSTHPDLDPLSVMDIIPENWSLSDKEGSLQLYLHVALSHSLHKSRVAKIVRHLSDMELIQTECEWTEYRKAFVRITAEKLCDVCKKKIGDRPFGVYPNGKVVHQKCMTAPNICPVTNINFESLV